MSVLEDFFRPDLAYLRPDEVVCKGCNYAHFHKLTVCPNPQCPEYEDLRRWETDGGR